MIKRNLIRVLLAFMVVAFIAVVGIQWIWIRSGMHEREDRFNSKVYNVLNTAVAFIDNMNQKRILTEIAKEIEEIENSILSVEKIMRDTNIMDSITELSTFLTNNFTPPLTLMHQQSVSKLQIQIIPAFQDPMMLNREFINQLGSYLGIGRREENSQLDPLKYWDVFKNLIIRMADDRESKEERVRKRINNPSLDLDSYLREKLSDNDIRIPYEYGILQEREIRERMERYKSKGFYHVSLFPDSEYSVNDYSLALIFDSKDSLNAVIYGSMDWMFIAAAFCIFGLMAVFIFTIAVIMRQQKLSIIKSEFINNMTHEFKTPLATISLATSAIEKERVLNDREQILKFNTVVKKENERMDKYVERILLQAKLDRREIHLKRVTIDINHLVSEAVQHFRLQVEDKSGDLHVELDPEGFVMEADEVHMFNVICNLIDNAIKYSPEILNIKVFTKRDKDSFIVGIQDSGIGIPKEAQNKVFKRFYRVPSGNIHNVKGFGLGLSYVKSIVYLHGGDIRLTSRKGKGTLVEIIFKI